MDLILLNGLPCWLSCKEPTCQYRKYGLSPWVGKIPWRRRWQPTLVLLPEKSYGQKGLAGYSPWDHNRATQSLQLNDTTILLNNLPTHLTEPSRSSAETHRAQSLPGLMKSTRRLQKRGCHEHPGGWRGVREKSFPSWQPRALLEAEGVTESSEHLKPI